MLLSYNKLILLDIDGGLDGLVGKKYPGSIGGEIFNCYEGTDRNEASGDYSTSIGAKNVTTQIHSFTGGYNNINNSENCFVFGQNNQTHRVSVNRYCMVVGDNNKCSDGDARECIVLGDGNNVVKSRQLRILGDANYIPNTHYRYGVIVGNRCANTPTLEKPIVTIACGDQYAAISKNAIEIDGTECKILNNLQLATDTTAVNAITPPQDPNNVTADDMTLVTVSHLGSSYRKSQVAYFSDYDSATSIPTDGTSVDFTTFGAKPAWANRALVTFRWENELIEKEIHFTRNEGIHLYVVQQAYSTFPDTIVYKHLRLEWDYTNQTLTAVGFWTYNQDMANAGAISGWDRTLTNASTCKILSVVYSE